MRQDGIRKSYSLHIMHVDIPRRPDLALYLQMGIFTNSTASARSKKAPFTGGFSEKASWVWCSGAALFVG